MAARYNPNYCNILIENKADVSAKTEKGKTYMDLLNENKYNNNKKFKI